MLLNVQRIFDFEQTIAVRILKNAGIVNMRPIEIIVNASSGSGDDVDRDRKLAEIFDGHGLQTRIHKAGTGEELVNFAKRAAASDAETIVAGGGDGTISAVAVAILGSGKKFGVLPFGTLNHFAKDLQIPSDLVDAVKVIAEGYSINVDVGEVNDRAFINNSSLGIYPDMVRGRELRQRLGYGKWHSLARSALTVFRRYPMLGVRLKADGKDIVARTPFIFIGNNEYELESFNIGKRARLDAGHLCGYMTRRTGRLALIRIALKALIGGLSQENDFLSVMTNEILIETRLPNIRVALDGEVVIMATPLRYSSRPGALRVIVPENPGSEDSNR